MIRFDGRETSPQDITAIKRLLAHRGKVKSLFLQQGVLLSFDGTLETDDKAEVFSVADTTLFTQINTESCFIPNYLRDSNASFNQPNADFAIALWDARRQLLLCARDILGVKPLYYVHQPGLFCAFATEIKALLAFEEVVVKPNRNKFREYLSWPKAYIPYSSETFYEGIYSVLPGHCLQLSRTETLNTPYWKPDHSRLDGLKVAGDYAAQFEDDFTSAIDSRMRSKDRIGSHLSGGLDSSAVSSMAQQLLQTQGRASVHTFTIDTGLSSTDETFYVKEVLKQWNPEHHTVQPIADVLSSILEINRLFDRPEQFIIPSSFHLSVSIKARQLGCDTILTGHDGDSVIPTGFDYLDQLIDCQDWTGLERACRQRISWPGSNFTKISDKWLSLSDRQKLEKYLLHLIGTEITNRFRREHLGAFLRSISNQKKQLHLSTASIIRYCIKRLRDKMAHVELIDSAFNPEFRQLTFSRNLQTTKGLNACFSGNNHVPVSQIINTTNVICNEQFDHIGAYYGHQYAFPFFDKRVVELGLSTPSWVNFDQGRGRGLIRNGLQNVLPAAIIDRQSKTNFVEYGNLSARQLYLATQEQFTLPSHAIWEIIDRTVFHQIVDVVFNSRIPIQQKTRYNWLLSRFIYFSLWLSSVSERR
ncbi:asparagine synthetase B family protein [Arundinibacter roseus]|uniref:asparagine synthase (glutamine-hydrolyzing) n=2 Tax=Arundinibacter roseus TaxID=2070510 RepID=A0A4R4KHJ2_9BACT|nr:asparagine synthetase B family protein [Arundinibacter roseus]